MLLLTDILEKLKQINMANKKVYPFMFCFFIRLNSRISKLLCLLVYFTNFKGIVNGLEGMTASRGETDFENNSKDRKRNEELPKPITYLKYSVVCICRKKKLASVHFPCLPLVFKFY